MNPAAFQEIESLKARIQLSQQRKTLAFYNKEHNSEDVTVAVRKCYCSKLVAHLEEVDSGRQGRKWDGSRYGQWRRNIPTILI